MAATGLAVAAGQRPPASHRPSSCHPPPSMHPPLIAPPPPRCTHPWRTTLRPSTAPCCSSSRPTAASWRRRARCGRCAASCPATTASTRPSRPRRQTCARRCFQVGDRWGPAFAVVCCVLACTLAAKQQAMHLNAWFSLRRHSTTIFSGVSPAALLHLPPCRGRPARRSGARPLGRG